MPARRETAEARSPWATGFQALWFEDLTWWVATNPRVAIKVLSLVEECRRDPREGTGKVEQLKHIGAGVYSRRITGEHRLVYRVDDAAHLVDFLQCRYHYGK